MGDATDGMTPNKPYLIRAINEWILDNDLTPHVIVNAESASVVIPTRYVEDGKIVLNISPNAVRELALDNHAIHFSARFSGKAFDVYVPIPAVMAVFARENGVGMAFQDGDMDDDPSPGPPKSPTRPQLRVVK